MTEVKQTDSNGLAIASLILGILSLTGLGILTGIPAIVTGAIGLRNPTNRGFSIAGLVMGTISTILTILVVIFFFVLLLAGAFAASSYQEDGDYKEPLDSFESGRDPQSI